MPYSIQFIDPTDSGTVSELKVQSQVYPSSVRLGFCMGVIFLALRLGGVIIQNPSLILDVNP